MRWLQVSLSALFILGVNSKGGSDKGGANNVQQYSGGGGVVTSPAAFASAGAFGAVVLLTAGSRRRYGTYHDANDVSMCDLRPEEEMQSSCLNLIGDEDKCHECLACETEDCMYNILNCDEYLATVFTECCVENCGDDLAGIVIGFFASICVCAGVCGCLWLRYKSSRQEAPTSQASAVGALQGQVVGGRAIPQKTDRGRL
mmetsp:Transcript_59348/g.130296  ORF Transcript_59348/g.130296 Transcript_59348/m.130296 type:complete len:201 (-) Transcript_59348:102-704(-)